MKLMILDGNSVINRAFYGVRMLTTRDGQPTNAIYGFLNIMQHMQSEERPDALCVAFDRREPTFRHRRYDGYKATRHPMPQELADQMPVMKQVLTAMRVPIYELAGWEADDVIGTVSRRCAEAGWDCVVVTGDRDSLQLVNDRVQVKLVVTKGGRTSSTNYTPDVFAEEYGFAPARLVDLKGLMGDSSDNLPGVAGVGPKTASELLQKFGTLDGVYEHLDDPSIRPRIREKLAQGRESAYLSYELAKIDCDAPIAFTPGENLLREPDAPALRALLLKLEFVKMIERLGLQETAAPAAPRPQLKSFPQPGTPCALLWTDAEVAVATAEGALCLPRLSCEAAFQALLDAGTPKACHDLKSILSAAGGDAPDGFVFDAALAAYLLDPAASDYALDRLAVKYLNQTPDGLAARADALWQLWQTLPPLLRGQGMWELYEQIELPLCRVLADMERTGVRADRAALHEFSAMLQQRIDDCTAAIYRCADEEFNINSTRELGRVLFEKLCLPHAKKTKTGYSTNAEVLEKLRPLHPIAQAVLDYRMLTKLKSTYADGLLKVVAADGRIHTTFQNTVTATGRLSSTDPNLQNIPVRTELGSELRRMFVPEPGWLLVDADYSQIELRVLAHVAEDAAMRAAFASGEDFHTVTASQVFGVPVSEVTPHMRRSAKAVNFGIVYGISDWALSEDLGVSVAEARSYISGYLARFPGVARYRTQVVEDAKRDGYVVTIFGRRRPLPELHSSNFNVRSGAERMALNTPIQGAAADIIKQAMLRVYNALRESGLRARLILQIHDELIVECPAGEAEQVTALLTSQMQAAAQLSVPLKAEAKTGKSWYDAK